MKAIRLGAIALMGVALCASVANAETLPGCAAALDYSQANNGVAVLVLEDGDVVCSSSDPDKPQEIWSGTKSIVGLMAAAAVQDHLLTLDERAADTLSEWQKDTRKSAITIRQLLSMTSGHASTVGRPTGYLESVKAVLTTEPGVLFQYGPTPMQIFGEILRRKLEAAGQDGNPRAYAERRILKPIGIKVDEWRNGPDGQPLMPQGMIISAREWAKLGEFVRVSAIWDGAQLVDPTAFQQLFEGSSANPAYGLTWWLPRPTSAKDMVTRSTDITNPAANLPADMVVAAGAGDQRLYVIPSAKLTIVRQAKLDLAALAAGERSAWSDAKFLGLLLSK
jgi:CubicO group peptidase (beta-lactamase class C family)